MLLRRGFSPLSGVSPERTGLSSTHKLRVGGKRRHISPDWLVYGPSLLDAMRDADTEGMQHFDGEIEKLVRAGIIDIDTGLAYATNAGNLRLQLSDLIGEEAAVPKIAHPSRKKLL